MLSSRSALANHSSIAWLSFTEDDALVGATAGHRVQAGMDHHAEVASALLDPALLAAWWARSSHVTHDTRTRGRTH